MKFIRLCETLEKIESTTKKNKKISFFSLFLTQLSLSELPHACYYSLGRPFATSSVLKIQFGWSSFMNIVNSITNRTRTELKTYYQNYADIGSLTEFAMSKVKPQPQSLDSFFPPSDNLKPSLSIEDLNLEFIKLASLTGKGSVKKKKELVLNLLRHMTPLETKYLSRIITSDTRTGFREGLLLDAIAQAFDRTKEDIRYAFMVLNDVGNVAKLAKTVPTDYDFTTLSPLIFNPIKVMLATKTETIEDALSENVTFICENKIDGFRAQLHIGKTECKLYSRNLEDVTEAFPEIISSITPEIRETYQPTILDGEIVGIKEGKPVFFQDLLTRIQRKKEIKEMAERTPVYFYIFDIIQFKGKSLLKTKLISRKEYLSQFPEIKFIKQVHYNISNNSVEIKALLDDAIEAGSEGLMLKVPNSVYLAGKRGKKWLKLKVSLPTLDLVIVAAEWGHGRRTGWLSNYHLAASDNKHNQFVVIGKTFKGLTDQEFTRLTEELNKLKIADVPYGIEVSPQIVVEVEFDNIQESSKYDSRMALRFARIKRIRFDKTVDEIDTIETVKELYQNQLQYQKRVK